MRFFLAALLLTLMTTVQVSAGEFEDGMEAYRNKDFASARVKWLPLAQSGHTFAMNNVGMMYKKGYGVPKDFKKAAKMFTR